MARPCTPLPKQTERRMRALLRETKTAKELRRVQCILLRCEGKPSSDIGEIVGMHPDSVRHVWSEYLERGEQVLMGENRGGRHRSHLTLKEETKLLQVFFRQAKCGQLITIRRFHAAVCSEIGKKVAPSTTYRMLHRHGWRKIVPLPTHPKGSREEREKFKEAFSPTR